MSNTSIGRNDPCPCGSGKKYKRCCLAKDERHAAAQRPPTAALEAAAVVPQLPTDPKRIPALLQELARTAPKGGRGGINRLLTDLQPVLTYMEREPEIEAACSTLEAHRAEFFKLADDEDAYLERTKALFAEERFAPLRFSSEAVRRAFGVMGQPANMASDDRFVETARAAILHLADKSLRSQSAMSLLMHLPDYVAAGRPLEAWILQHCAHLTTEAPNENNPFLFQMFSYGYDAWVAQQRTREAAMLREVGLELPHLEGMSLNEIDAWLAQQQADPAKQARLEAIMKAHPDQRALAVANLQEMERNSVELLERADAAGLLLSQDELAPWVPRLLAAFNSVLPQVPDPAGPAPDPALGEALVQAIQPVLGRMAEAIFTAARRRQLVAQLKDYRNDLFAAGDKRAAGLAQSASISVEQEDQPAQNRFLNVLCFVSTRGAKDPMSEGPPADETQD
jgi:hypothetical protein